MKLLRRLPAVLVLALLVSGCGGGPSARPAPTATTPATTPSTGGGAAGSAHDLVMTPAVRRQLVAVATRSRRQRPGSYSGFERGSTYYGYDPATRTWWAAGALVAVDPAGGAAVALNDQGAYDVFHRTAGGTWVDRQSGEAGYDPPLAQCDGWPPKSILRLWHWSLTVCAEPRWG